MQSLCHSGVGASLECVEQLGPKGSHPRQPGEQAGMPPRQHFDHAGVPPPVPNGLFGPGGRYAAHLAKHPAPMVMFNRGLRDRRAKELLGVEPRAVPVVERVVPSEVVPHDIPCTDGEFVVIALAVRHPREVHVPTGEQCGRRHRRRSLPCEIGTHPNDHVKLQAVLFFVPVDHVLAVGAVSYFNHEATRRALGTERCGRRQVVRPLALDRRRVGKSSAGLLQHVPYAGPVIAGRLHGKNVCACRAELTFPPREADRDTPPSAELGTTSSQQQRPGRAGQFERVAPRPERSVLREGAPPVLDHPTSLSAEADQPSCGALSRPSARRTGLVRKLKRPSALRRIREPSKRGAPYAVAIAHAAAAAAAIPRATLDDLSGA
eukprot:scaffold46220_cov53-Phaeocystis_antarctica.AAC.4